MRASGGRLLTVLLWGCVLLSAPLVAVRWFDSSVGIIAVLQSLAPLTGLLVAVLVVTATLTKRWRAAAVGAVLLAGCLMIAVPSVRGGDTAVPAGDDLVVMSANLLYGGADAPSLVAAVREHRVDVLVLVEVTSGAVQRLSAAGLDVSLPESVGRSRQDAGGTIVRSRFPLALTDAGRGQASTSTFDQPVVSIAAPTGTVVLRAIHSPSPSPFEAAEWRSGLADLETWREKQPLKEPLLMVGDFNASWGHPGFRRVAETMTDAHRAAGQGWVRTWPQGWRVIRPFVQLDHVMARGLSVVDAGVVQLPKTDHSAVWARLSRQDRDQRPLWRILPGLSLAGAQSMSGHPG